MGFTMPLMNMLNSVKFDCSRLLAFYWLPRDGSTTAPDIHDMWNFFYVVAIFFTVLVVGLMLFFMFRYRMSAKRQKADPSATHNTALELTWTGIPLIIVMVMFVVGFKGYMNIDTPPGNSIDIKVLAQQWFWTFTYPNGAVSKTLYLPLDRPVRFEMTSNDVLHGFWIPALSVQRDVIPGRIITTWVEATRLGKFHLQCSEYCGDGHSRMISPVIVEPYSKYLADIKAAANIWVGADGKPLPLPKVGEKLYNLKGCSSCHTVNGAPGTGPTWHNLAGSQVKLNGGGTATADYAYLSHAIMDPDHLNVQGYAKGVMPDNYIEQLGGKGKYERKINAIIAYMNTISKYSNPASMPPAGAAAPAPSAPAAVAPPAGGVPKAAAAHVAAGKKIAMTVGCTACHSVNGTPSVCPTWQNLAGSKVKLKNGKTVVADYDYLRTMILQPGKMNVAGATMQMPNMSAALVGPQFHGDQRLNDLIWYINSLSKNSNKASQPPRSSLHSTGGGK